MLASAVSTLASSVMLQPLSSATPPSVSERCRKARRAGCSTRRDSNFSASLTTASPSTLTRAERLMMFMMSSSTVRGQRPRTMAINVRGTSATISRWPATNATSAAIAMK